MICFLLFLVFTLNSEWRVGIFYNPIKYAIKIKDWDFKNPNGVFAPVLDDIGGKIGQITIKDKFFYKELNKIANSISLKFDHYSNKNFGFMQSIGFIFHPQKVTLLKDSYSNNIYTLGFDIKYKPKFIVFGGLYGFYKVKMVNFYLGGELVLQGKDEWTVKIDPISNVVYKNNNNMLRIMPCLGMSIKLNKKLYFDLNARYLYKKIDRLDTSDLILPLSFKPQIHAKMLSCGLMIKVK